MECTGSFNSALSCGLGFLWGHTISSPFPVVEYQDRPEVRQAGGAAHRVQVSVSQALAGWEVQRVLGQGSPHCACCLSARTRVQGPPALTASATRRPSLLRCVHAGQGCLPLSLCFPHTGSLHRPCLDCPGKRAHLLASCWQRACYIR